MSDTIIKYGDDLVAPVLQPGWTIEQDGFGMLQVSAKFKWAKSEVGNFPERFKRGDPFPESNYNNLCLFKASMSVEKGEVVTVTADYCGLANSGGYDAAGHSDPQIMMTGASASESIQSHPNFITVNCLNFGDVNPLAGYPPTLGGFDSNLTTNPNRAAWTPKVAGSGLVNNCQFIGFLPNQDISDATPNIKAGIKSYYKPQTTLRVLVYFKDESEALDRASIVGFITDGSAYYLPEAYKALALAESPYSGTFTYSEAWTDQIHKSFLVTNASVERFGSLWKVTADLMLSGMGGWDIDVYTVSSLG
jgi:hypothetical protein